MDVTQRARGGLCGDGVVPYPDRQEPTQVMKWHRTWSTHCADVTFLALTLCYSCAVTAGGAGQRGDGVSQDDLCNFLVTDNMHNTGIVFLLCLTSLHTS